MFEKVKAWWKRRNSEHYVLVYDRHPPSEEPLEEYYGYFSTPAEALAVWKMYAFGYQYTRFTNVKLCRIVGTLPDVDNVSMTRK